MGNAEGKKLRMTLKFQEQLTGKLVKERRALRRQCSINLGFKWVSEKYLSKMSHFTGFDL